MSFCTTGFLLGHVALILDAGGPSCILCACVSRKGDVYNICIDIFTNRRLRFYLETILQNVHMPLRNLMQKFFLLVGGYFACNIHFSQVDSLPGELNVGRCDNYRFVWCESTCFE